MRHRPRRAGMNRCGVHKWPQGRRRPRMDGGPPSRLMRIRSFSRATPHGRGSAGFSQSTGPPVAGRPAWTGVCRRGQLLLHIEVRPPRMDGGLPTLRRVDRLGMPAAPHGRGSAHPAEGGSAGYAGRPAWTGVCRNGRKSSRDRRRLPRMGGGLPRDERLMVISKKIAPHGRGSAPGFSSTELLTGTTPPGREFAKCCLTKRFSRQGRPAKTGVCPAPAEFPGRTSRPPRRSGDQPPAGCPGRKPIGATPPGRGSAQLRGARRRRAAGHPAGTGVCPPLWRCRPGSP